MSEPIREFEEMYMKTLYGLAEGSPGEPIRTSQVAEAMEVSAASASEMGRFETELLTEKDNVEGFKG